MLAEFGVDVDSDGSGSKAGAKKVNADEVVCLANSCSLGRRVAGQATCHRTGRNGVQGGLV